MKNRKLFRIVVMVACFLFAGLNLLKVVKGEHTTVDLFLMVMFFIFGVLYAFMLFRKDRQV
ncbi:hypothetical protein ACXYMU_12865 [Pontibacter sp. CAU 1760]